MNTISHRASRSSGVSASTPVEPPSLPLPARLRKYVAVLPHDVVLYHWSPASWGHRLGPKGQLPPIQHKGLGRDRTGYVNELGNGLYCFDNPLTGARYGQNGTGAVLRMVLKKGSRIFVMPEYRNTGGTSSGGGSATGMNSARLMLGDDKDYEAFSKVLEKGFRAHGVDALLAVEWEYASSGSWPGLAYVNVVNGGAVKDAAFESPEVEREIQNAARSMPGAASHVNVVNRVRRGSAGPQSAERPADPLAPKRLMDVICDHPDFAANRRSPIYRRPVDPSLVPDSWL